MNAPKLLSIHLHADAIDALTAIGEAARFEPELERIALELTRKETLDRHQIDPLLCFFSKTGPPRLDELSLVDRSCSDAEESAPIVQLWTVVSKP